jgi:hypothetical protein
MHDAARSPYVCPSCRQRDNSEPVGAGWEYCSDCNRLWTAKAGPVSALELLVFARALEHQPEVANRLRRAGDALVAREVATEGAYRIALERARQIAAAGWPPGAELEFRHEELAAAAACYAMPHSDARRWASRLENGAPLGWPFPADQWKPAPSTGGEEISQPTRADRIRELEIAGALIAAELDRLLELEARETTQATQESTDDPQP